MALPLPRPWIPVEQDEDLDGLTEEDLEQRIQTIKAQIDQTQQNLRARSHHVEHDVEAGGLAEKVAETLADSGSAAPIDVVQEANAVVQQEDERLIADLHRELDAAEALKRQHDEMNYAQAWLNACEYLRDIEREAVERLANAIEQIKTAASQVTFLPQSFVMLALPGGDENMDLHYVREQALKSGERLIEEKTELTVIRNSASHGGKSAPNAALKISFKVAQFAYYAGVLARYAGDALKAVLAQFHHALEHFLPMLSAVARAMT